MKFSHTMEDEGDEKSKHRDSSERTPNHAVNPLLP